MLSPCRSPDRRFAALGPNRLLGGGANEQAKDRQVNSQNMNLIHDFAAVSSNAT
jgi:hypothetical protein